MKPVLFSLGPLDVHTYGVMIALGLLVSLSLMMPRARRDGFPSPPERAVDLAFVTVIGGFLGARIHYVLQHAAWYAQAPLKMFAVWEGGLIFYGGVAGSLLALAIFVRWKGISLRRVLDFLIPYVALTHAFGRIGCFLNSCCYGKICFLPWGVTFPGHDHPVHPTQLYEAFFNFCLFLFLNARYPHRRYPGQIFALYLMLYAVGRFGIEFFRGDNPMWGWLTSNQWVSLAGLAVGFVLARVWRRHA